MPSNKEYIDEILAIDSDAQVEGLKNADLAALLKYLKSTVQAPVAPDVPPVAPCSYVVAPGKCITSLRGILVPGDVAEAEHFAGGQETFDTLIENGTLV